MQRYDGNLFYKSRIYSYSYSPFSDFHFLLIIQPLTKKTSIIKWYI